MKDSSRARRAHNFGSTKRQRRADFQAALAAHHSGNKRLKAAVKARRAALKNDPKRLGTA